MGGTHSECIGPPGHVVEICSSPYLLGVCAPLVLEKLGLEILGLVYLGSEVLP